MLRCRVACQAASGVQLVVAMWGLRRRRQLRSHRQQIAKIAKVPVASHVVLGIGAVVIACSGNMLQHGLA
jgi:hypothetical protein